MNVLHITFSDRASGGGSTIFAQNLQNHLLKKGAGSRTLCREKAREDRKSIYFPKVKIADWVAWKLTASFGLNNLAALNSFALPNKKYFAEADVLHFHSIHTDNFNYLALPHVTKKKPAVWTFHDTWAMTGHCSMNFDCERWKTGCGKCPYPETWPPIKHDATALEWKLKKWAYDRSRLTIVAPSQWMFEMVKKSICKDLPTVHIPYGIDTDAFKPMDKALVRQALGIPSNKKVLMAGSVNVNEYRKGGDLLKKALQLLPVSFKKDLLLLTMGYNGEDVSEDTGVDGFHMGYLSSNVSKAICYSAADLFVFPTRSETFGLVMIESMACETPVVGFRVGGLPDAIRDGITGFLAKPEDAEDLSKNILKFFEEPSLGKAMGARGREMVLKEFSLDLSTQRYMDLYKTVSG